MSYSGPPVIVHGQSAEQRDRIARSVADVARPFPADWLAALRIINPIADAHSHLRPYWYAVGERWVLYDCVPRALIDPDRPVCTGMTGAEFLSQVEGKAPRDRDEEDRTPYVSDVQHEFYRLFKVYARPFWVLQGDAGGHQVDFGPWQRNLLAAQGMPLTPPAIGSLPTCPFDQRVVEQLMRHSRLQQMAGDIDRLHRSGSKEATELALQEQQRQIREAELAFLQYQMEPLLDAAQTVSRRADSRDHLMYVQDGTAGQASDALQTYLDTGTFTL